MPDYQLGKIYKVVNDVNGMVYIGSTAQPTLANRMTHHRSDYKRNYSKTYEKWGDIQDCKIVLIEKFPCESKDELCARERYFIENTDCINIVVPGRTQKEWCEINKDKIKERKKEYYQKNKEQISERDKKYYQNNKDNKKEYDKKYYQNNKEIINKKYNCDCGGKYTYYHKAKHFKTDKHQRYLKSQSNTEDALWFESPTQETEKDCNSK